jgi:hypothetical protein
MGISQKVPKKYLVGNDWANGFKTHNELTMYPLGKYPLAPSVTDRSSQRSNSDTSFASQDRIPPRGPTRETEGHLPTTSIVLPSSHPVMEMWDQVFRSSVTSGRLIGPLKGIPSYWLELVVQLSAEDGDAMLGEILARRGQHYNLRDGQLMTFRPSVDRVDF